MAKKQEKFTASGFDYGMNQATETPVKEEPTTKSYYRFNAKFPIEYKAFLQEMAWRSRCTVTEYLSRLVLADMEAHPEWKDTIDVLNR